MDNTNSERSRLDKGANAPRRDKDEIAMFVTEGGPWQKMKEQYSIIERTDVFEKIKSKTQERGNRVWRFLQVGNPYHDEYERLRAAERQMQQGDFSFPAIKSDLSDFESCKRSINPQPPDDPFWRECLSDLRGQQAHLLRKSRKEKKPAAEAEMAKLKSKRAGLRKSLLAEWRKTLDRAYTAWELEQLNKFRREILAEFESWLNWLQQLFDCLGALSMEPGLLFDLSPGSLTDTDVQTLKQWADYISRDEGTKRLCDMLGRLRQAEHSKREEIVKHKTKIQVTVPDVNSREEITGITLGRDIENVIPAELALLSDADTALLFDIKYVESRLLMFETRGTRTQEREKEETKKIQVRREEEKMGPVIICVDTSYSMEGTPETIAKAVTLYMAARAASQDRNCYLINFSTDIETLDLSGGVGMEKVIRFLRKSFHGGTDAAPALEHAVAKIGGEDYAQADVLTISDFLMGDLPEDLVKDISAAKQRKNRFYSLCIRDAAMGGKLKSVFDKEWIYSPSDMGIKELHNFVRTLDE